jgi:hypothetical protein
MCLSLRQTTRQSERVSRRGNHKRELFWNADRAGHLKRGTGVGNVPERARKCRAAELDGCGLQDPAPCFRPSLVHRRTLDVNVGTSNVNANWLRWDLWNPKNTNSSGSSYCSQGSSSWFTMAHCIGHGYTWNHTVGTPNKSQWNGCVADRDRSYDVNPTVPTFKR